MFNNIFLESVVPNMLKIENLSIVYGDRIILDDVSVEFPKGYVSVIQGESGSGKSSLLNVLGLMQKSNKECKYYNDSVEISKYTEKEKADFRLHNMGFIFQQNNLIQELSSHENVSLPLMVFGQNKKYMQKVNELLDYVGVSHLYRHYPGSLSGGEEQRIAIARALANDANIILADEPTASLDDTNAKIILELLKKLAHELNKIVVIVSHDAQVLKIADFVYKIENKKIVHVSGEKVPQDKRLPYNDAQEIAFQKRKIFDFIQFYTKSRIGDKVLNKIFVAITALIAAIAIIFVNFGSEYTKGQNDFINAISDKSIFVVNDTLGLNGDTDYDAALSMTNETLTNIEQIPNIHKWYPYYEFSSSGFSSNDNDIAEITIKDGNNIILNKKYGKKEVGTSDIAQFAVAPLYPEENLDFLLDYKNDTPDEKGIMITNALAKQLSTSPEQLVDKEIELQAFVPVKLYDTKITRSANAQDREAEDRGVLGDGAFYKLVTIKSKIIGVLSPTYNLQRSEIKDVFLLDYETFNNILTSNKDENYGEEFNGFPEKELAPSSLIIFANSYNDVPMIISKLQTISPVFSVSNRASDVRTIQNNIDATKNIMMLITIVFIGIIILMFGMLYYMKNRSRKKEVGILKALGLTSNNIVHLITFEMGNIALKSFINALVIALIFTYIGNGIFGIHLFNITFLSIGIGLLVSVGIVIVAGVLPVYNASKVDPIHAIREINR